MKQKLYTITLLIYLAVSANASLMDLSKIEPGGFMYWHNDHWDMNGIHVDPPQSVPEPHSPFVLLVIAGMALLMKRTRN